MTFIGFIFNISYQLCYWGQSVRKKKILIINRIVICFCMKQQIMNRFKHNSPFLLWKRLICKVRILLNWHPLNEASWTLGSAINMTSWWHHGNEKTMGFFGRVTQRKEWTFSISWPAFFSQARELVSRAGCLILTQKILEIPKNFAPLFSPKPLHVNYFKYGSLSNTPHGE